MSETISKSGGHTCPWWLIYTFDNPLRKIFQNPTKILNPYVSPGDTVLDLGCGMGYFTISLAALVGAQGKVLACDLQEKMLAGLKNRAQRAGLDERIYLIRSTAEDIGVQEPVDFVLAFWMVHEVQRPDTFIEQVFQLLKPQGKFLIVEPLLHVSGQAFSQTADLAQQAGLHIVDKPKVSLSRAILLNKSQG